MPAPKAPSENSRPTDGMFHAVGSTRISYAFVKDTGVLEIVIEIWCQEHDEIKSYYIRPEDALEYFVRPIQEAVEKGRATERQMKN